MYPSYDMSPIAIEQMRRERLAADIEKVDNHRGARLRVGGAAIVVLLALVILV